VRRSTTGDSTYLHKREREKEEDKQKDEEKIVLKGL
jgi:hypothetical protein